MLGKILKQKKEISLKDRILGNVKNIGVAMKEAAKDSKGFVESVKERFVNLSETNYNVGVHHFNKGNIWDATFRFKFIDKRWPELKDSKYYLAYCQALNEHFEEAKKILHEFVSKNKMHSGAKKLLKILEKNDVEALVEDYENIVREHISKATKA